jgi:hypothetical protein
VLASNVPALALPAIALGALAGAVVVVKSGRDDPRRRRRSSTRSARRCRRSPRPSSPTTGRAARRSRGPALARADVTVLTGGDAALARSRRACAGGACCTGRARASPPSRATRSRTALRRGRDRADAALYEQRGCLSPHAVWVEDGGAARPDSPAVAARSTRCASACPSARARRGAAAVRSHGTRASTSRARGFLGAPAPASSCTRRGAAACVGGRTLRVHPIRDLAALAACSCRGRSSASGSRAATAALAAALRARGVARLCPSADAAAAALVAARAAAAARRLLGRDGDPVIEVEP